MQVVDVVYFIEHTARELDIACAVKYLLLSKGINVEICSIVIDLDETLARWNPNVVVLPYGTNTRSANLERIIPHWGAACYVNLSFEQILGKAQKSFKAPKDRFARQHMLYTAWGEFFVDFLMEHGVAQQNITLVGNPAFTLYTQPYRNYYGNLRAELAQKFKLSMDRRWVLIPENYGWAFFKDNNVRDRIQRGFDPQDAFQYRDFARDSLRASANWWREAAELDGIELIVRPRPAIPVEMFRDAVLEMAGEIPPHLHVIKYRTVREWILVSDLVFSSYSTTLLDAAVADKPAYMLTPYSIPDFLYAEWYDVTAKVSTYDDFAAAVQAEPLEANWEALQNWVKTQMMSQGDAITNIANVIQSIVHGEKLIPPPTEIAVALRKPSFDRFQRKVRHYGWEALQSVLALTGKATEKDWNPHERDLVDPTDVAQRVDRWADVLGR